jgi:hypothetical protein
MSAGFPYEITLEANVTYSLFATGQNVYFQTSNLADINNKVTIKTQFDEARLNVGMGVEMSDQFGTLFVEAENAQTITLFVSDRGIYDNRLSLDSSVVQTATANTTKLLNETTNANVYSMSGYAPTGSNAILALTGYAMVSFTEEVYISNLVFQSFAATGASMLPPTPPNSTIVAIFNDDTFAAAGNGYVNACDLYDGQPGVVGTVRTSPSVFPTGTGRIVGFKRSISQTLVDQTTPYRPFFDAEKPLRIAVGESLFIYSSDGGQVWFTCDVRTNSAV